MDFNPEFNNIKTKTLKSFPLKKKKKKSQHQLKTIMRHAQKTNNNATSLQTQYFS